MRAPIPCRWDGEHFIPLPGFAKRCDEQFVVGKVYTLVEQEGRTTASHRHLFACVNEAWANLPEDMAERFPTPDHLRRYALIKAGFASKSELVCASRAEALRCLELAKRMDSYVVATAEGPVLTIWTALSQSQQAMGKQDFQASKDAVLRVIAEMIGVSPDTLQQQAGQSA